MLKVVFVEKLQGLNIDLLWKFELFQKRIRYSSTARFFDGLVNWLQSKQFVDEIHFEAVVVLRNAVLIKKFENIFHFV